jgi:CelD/BcsL family acetyltransferase involved in cellulose biosynthesis
MPQVNTNIIEHYTTEYVAELFDAINEHANTGNLFLSPFWLLTWLETLDSLPFLLICQRDRKVIGFGFWGKQTDLLGNTFYLNQTGEHSSDQVWTEHNNLICQQNEREAVVEAMLQTLFALPKTNKLVIRNTCSDCWPNSLKLACQTDAENSAYVDLTKEDYLTSLSKNSRSAIKRSNKLIQSSLGAITVNKVDVTSEPSIMNELADIHIQRWGDSEFGSGFSNPKFVAFHAQLLKSNALLPDPKNDEEYEHQAELLKVTAGDTCLGYLYMLKQNQHVLFYLSAISYSSEDNKIKPGMSMHFAAIEYYNKRGFTRYDFLAGAARYKEQMSNAHYPVYQIELYAPTLKNRVYRWLKRCKQGASA